jgi:CheY-like chemotaxis protein
MTTAMTTAMTKDASKFSDWRIGLVACASIEGVVTGALRQAQASFAHLDAIATGPGDADLDRFHALILHIGESAGESGWFQPKQLRTNSRPLLLATGPEAIYSREALWDHADDIVFAPYLPAELIFRLSRLIGGGRDGRHAVVPSAKPCVVVAEDDPDIVTLLRRALERLDVDAHFVSDGLGALAAARRLLPDLLLLDIGLPFVNGIEVLRCLRNDPGTSTVVALLLTASADPLHVAQSVDLGAVDYILKPFGYFDLIRKLKPLLRNQAAR